MSLISLNETGKHSDQYKTMNHSAVLWGREQAVGNKLVFLNRFTILMRSYSLSLPTPDMKTMPHADREHQKLQCTCSHTAFRANE